MSKPTEAEHRAYLQALRDARAALVKMPTRRSKERFAAEVESQRPAVSTHEAYLMGGEEAWHEMDARIRDLITLEEEVAKGYAPRAPVVSLASRRPSGEFAANRGRGSMSGPYYCGCRVDGIPVEAHKCPEHGRKT